MPPAFAAFGILGWHGGRFLAKIDDPEFGSFVFWTGFMGKMDQRPQTFQITCCWATPHFHA